MTRRTYHRRQLLAGAGTAGSLALAGCLGDLTGSGGEDADAPLAEHPVGQNLADQPRLGDSDAPATVVVLDDPSCPRCADFHENTLATLEDEYVDAGELTIVNRTYPVVYDWGEPAAQTLEATFDRDEDAFWSLLGYYFGEQSGFDADNVFDRSESWLDEHTDLDAAAVVSDAEDGAFDDRLDANIDAGEEAGAGGVTPASFLFADGEFQTSLNGSVSPTTFETVLGL